MAFPLDTLLDLFRDVTTAGTGTGAIRVTGTGTGGSSSVDIEQVKGVAIDSGSGASSAATIRVILATDNPTVNVAVVQNTSGTATLSSVTASLSSVVVLSSNGSRRGFIIYNATTATAFIAMAATSSTSAYSFQIAAGSVYESIQPDYTGIISAIWTTASGALKVTEFT